MSKSDKPNRKKPTGKIGPISARMGERGISVAWEIISFPQKKDEIEQYFCSMFVKHISGGGRAVHAVTQNAENANDFELALPRGRVQLELVEYVRPSQQAGSLKPLAN